MPLTAEQAIDQVKANIQEKGKFNIGNLFDGIIAVVADNSIELQAMLDKLLTKKGVLNEADEKAVQDLLARQELEKKKRQQRRTGTVLIIGTAVAVLAGIYFLAHKKK